MTPDKARLAHAKDLIQVKNLKKYFPVRGGVLAARGCLGAGGG